MRSNGEPFVGSVSTRARTFSVERATSSLDTGSGSSQHLGFLDGIRGLAAGYVVLHHVVLNVPRSPLMPWWERALRTSTSFGHYAVDLFIVLSGYCLMLPVLRATRAFDATRFLVRRAARILPPYYAAMVLSWALIAVFIGRPSGTHWDVSLPVSNRDVIAHLLLVHDLSSTSAPKINHTHWSVAVEWKLYFCFPLLLWCWKRFGSLATVLTATVSSYLLWMLLNRFELLNPSPWGSSVYYLGLFAFGMLAADLAEGTDAARLSPRFRQGFGISLAALSVGLLLISSHHFGRIGTLPLQVRSAAVGAWSATLLIALRIGSLPAVVSAWVANRPLEWLGRRGFSLYLTHAPVLELVYRCLGLPARTSTAERLALMFAVATPASVLVAAAFYQAIERPSHELSRRLNLSRQSPAVRAKT